MSTKRSVRIGSGSSESSRVQAYEVLEALRSCNPDQPISLHPMECESEVAALRAALREGSIDIAVHSWKDLPLFADDTDSVLAVLPRADRRDVLLLKKTALSRDSTSELCILSSSARRKTNVGQSLPELLPAFRGSLSFRSVRGSVVDRVRTLMESQAQGILVAKSALDRLLTSNAEDIQPAAAFLRAALSELHFMVLPLSESPCAAAQGALAVEVRSDDAELLEDVKRISCKKTHEEVFAERAITRRLGGSCAAALGVSVEVLPFGKVTSIRGTSSNGENHAERLLEQEGVPFPRALAQNVFPQPREREGLFERRNVPCSIPDGAALWVARVDGLPQGVDLHNRFIWTAGVTTWRKLAERGVWVHGCADGLGESMPPGIDVLAGRPVSWLKLTHAASASEGEGAVLGTYELLPATIPNLEGRTHFYWSSGSAFDACVRNNPGIVSGFHACGPGATAAHLAKKLGPQGKLRIFLNETAWRQEVLQ
ncbi:MAG: hypothetical protein J0M12_09990 [Deltaproteobacteria bacterium]|nr:hypothetical protein [Deltaproteobacteria bacterium]